MKAKKEVIVGLIGFLLVSLVLRFYRLDFQSLWFDELVSANNASGTLAGIIQNREEDMNPPFYDFIVYFLFKILGPSDFTIRGLSAMAGSLAPPLLFLFCFRNFNRSVAYLAATALAFSPFAISYSQEARPYSLLMLFSILYLFMGWEIFRRNNRKYLLYSSGFVASGAVLLNLHYSSAFFLVAATPAWLLILRKYAPKRLFLLASNSLFIILSFSFWISNFFSEAANWPKAAVMSRFKSLPQVIEQLLMEFFSYHSVSSFFILVMVMVGIFFVLKEKKWDVFYDFSILIAIPIVFFAFIFGIITYNQLGIFQARHAIIVLPILLLVISKGLSFSIRNGAQLMMMLALIAFMSIHSLIASEYYTKVQKEDFRGITKKIADSSRMSAEPIMPVINAGFGKYMDYYFQLMGSPYRVSYDWPKQRRDFKRDQPEEFWLVVYTWLWPHWDEKIEMPGYKSLEIYKFNGMDLYKMRRVNQLKSPQ